MAIQIKAPDGSIAQFPDGTPDQTIQSVMAKTFGGPSGGMDMAAAPPTEVAPVDVAAPSLANAPMSTAGRDMAAPPPTHGQMLALSMSPEQLHAYMANTDPNMSTGEDVGRSMVSAAQRAAGGVAGMVGDVQNLWGNGVQNGAEWLLRHSGMLSPEQIAAQKAHPLQQENFAHYNGVSDSGDYNRVIQGATGPYHDPQTQPGKYAGAVASMWPAAIGVSGAALKVGVPLFSGLASEAAGQSTHDLGPGWETAARVLAAMGAGGAVTGLRGLARTAPEILAANAPNLTRANVQEALDLMRHGVTMGPGGQPTIAEAVQAATNGATGMGRLQRTIESTPRGGDAMREVLAQRSGTVRAAAARYADAIAPPTTEPSMIGVRAQKAAVGALDKARQDVNAVAKPSYDALPGQTMDPAQYAAVSANPSYTIALKALRSDPELGPALKGLPDNDISVVNAVVKRLGTTGEQAKGTPLAPGDNELAAARFSAKAQADAAARAASPDYANARDTVAKLSAEQVDPLKAGPEGAISNTTDRVQASGALYPSGPQAVGSAPETVRAIQNLRAQNPVVPPELLRQHLLGALEGMPSDFIQGGMSPYAGLKYAKAIAGSPEQAATLNAGVAETSGQAAADELQRNLAVMRAHGMRMPTGSPTAEKLTELKDLGVSLGEKSSNPVTWMKNAASDAMARARTDQMIRLLRANPDEAQAILDQAIRQQGRIPGVTGALMAGAIAGNGQ